MFRNIFTLVLLFPGIVFADDLCSRFKYDPEININKVINSDVNIKKSAQSLDYELGHAIMQPGYEFRFYIVGIPVDGGFCASLRGIDINVQYPDFDIEIDKDLKEGGCAYELVIKHEKDHVITTRKVLDNNLETAKEDILNPVAQSINPIFVTDIQGMDAARINMGQQLENHPDVIALMQKIRTEIAEENKKIDTRGDQYEIYKCQDFFEGSKKDK